MELIDLIPNSMSFRVVSTVDVRDHAEVPAGFTGRVRRSDGRVLVSIAWYVRGKMHNPGKTHPAYRQFRSNGAVKSERFYRDGVLHDPSPSAPAVTGFYANGVVHYEERYREGLRDDGPDGVAAVRKWRHDGSLRHELHYMTGRRQTTDDMGTTSGTARRKNLHNQK